MKFINFALLLFVFALMLFSCQKKEECKYSDPEAIFSEELPALQRHNFILRNQTGIENLEFKDGSSLTIYQSGCDYIKQDYEFEVDSPSDTVNSYYWIDMTVRKFQFLGRLDSQYYSFASWAQAIEQQSETMKLAKFQEVQPGFFAKIDAIEGKRKSTLLVTLSEQAQSQ